MHQYIKTHSKSRLLPLKDAASRVTYSYDYVARLAREGKIKAEQTGRRWYIDPVSLESFAQTSASEERVKNFYKREQRLREREVHQMLEDASSNQVRQLIYTPFVANLLALFVVTVGVFLGGAAVTVESYQDPALQITESLNTNTLARKIAQHSTVAIVASSALTQLQTADVQESNVAVPINNDVMLLPQKTLASSEANAQLFSDKVLVSFTSSSTGSVRLNDRSASLQFAKQYVPTTQNTAAATHWNTHRTDQ